jgi:hypothetical protein
MSSKRWLLALASLALGVTWPRAAHPQDSTWHIIGQVRPRFEYRSGYRTLPPVITEPVVFVSQRTRLGAEYRIDPKIRLVVVMQDVRTWGDELSTADPSADKIDAHFAYGELIPNEHWALQIGRQEFSYDEQRILGACDWVQAGRVHDAVRLKWHNRSTDLHLAWTHHETGEPTSTQIYNNTDNYEDLVFLWGSTRRGIVGASGLVLYDNYDRTWRILIQDRWTAGARLTIEGPAVQARLEGYYQMGSHKLYFRSPDTYDWDRFVHDLAAFMMAAEVTYVAPSKSSVTLWYDYLSGDRDSSDGRYTAFDVPYAGNHRFYGWADLVLKIPDDTNDRGLQDLALKFHVEKIGPVMADIHGHYFFYAQRDPMGDRALGFEGDLMVTADVMNHARLQAGYSVVLPTDALKRLKHSESAANWFWVMLDVNVK